MYDQDRDRYAEEKAYNMREIYRNIANVCFNRVSMVFDAVFKRSILAIVEIVGLVILFRSAFVFYDKFMTVFSGVMLCFCVAVEAYIWKISLSVSSNMQKDELSRRDVQEMLEERLRGMH